MTNGLGTILIIVIVLVVAIAIAWFLLSRLYERSSTERSFVRTGFLGRKVVISGGAVVIPVLHQVIRVNMNTVRLSIRRENERALISQDRMRVNVEVDFYLRVEAKPEAVSLAAQTLGSRTMSAEALQDLIEGKFVDALRAVAAEMTMEALHEQRQMFARKVRDLLRDELAMNGLTIESASIAQLDQASREFFNPNNAFDAAGLTRLTGEIEERRRRRNEIEQDTQVAIQLKNLEAERQVLDIQREEEYARLGQAREIAIRRAQQAAEVATEQAQRKRESEEATIRANQALERTRLAADRTVAEERIEIERTVKELEVARARSVEIAEIERRKAIEIADQIADIEIAQQATERSAAQAQAESARAAVVKAEEQVISARDVERAEREKLIQLIVAAAESERQSVQRRGVAETSRYVATVEADVVRMRAEAESAAEKLQVAAAELRHALDASSRRAINEADNVLSPETRDLRVKLATIERMEGIIRESVKPLERIDGIKILQVDGLGGGGNGAAHSGSAGSLSDQIVNSALRYRGQAPLVDYLLKEIGLTGSEITSVANILQNRSDLPAIPGEQSSAEHGGS
jgi:uncharacterized membrane protein YqiK